MTRPEGSGRWQAPLDDVMDLPPPQRLPFLLEICLRAEVTVRSLDELLLDRYPGFGPPAGVPPAAATRHSARLALGMARPGTPAHAVAGVFATWQPQPPEFSVDGTDEVAAHRRRCEDAVSTAREHGDLDLLVWTLRRLFHAARGSNDWDQADAAISEAAGLCTRHYSAGHPAQAIRMRPYESGLRRMTQADRRVAKQAISNQVWRQAATSARASGNLTRWSAAVDNAVDSARGLGDRLPEISISAYTAQAQLARVLGDRAAARAIEAQVAAQAARSQPGSAWTNAVFRFRAYNATSVRDYDGAAQAFLDRFLDYLEREPDAPQQPARPAEWLPLLARLIELGDRDRYNGAANSAYDRAAAMYNSGLTAASQDGYDEALEWISVAEHVWTGWGHNGLWAIKSLRARMAATHPTAPQFEQPVADLAEVAIRAPNTPARINAAVAASEYCPAGHGTTLEAISHLLDSPRIPTDRGRLLSAKAEWHRKALQADSPGAGDWAVAEAAAREAADLLHAAARPLYASEAAVAWGVLETAALRVGDDSAGQHARRLKVLCVAQQLVDASTVEHRARLASRYAPFLRDTLADAVRRGDVDDVDLLAEAVRRDSVGLMISRLIGDDQAPEALREAVEGERAAGTADPESLADEQPAPPRPENSDHGGPPTGSPPGDGVRGAPASPLAREAQDLVDRARAISAQRADRELGLVAAAMDVTQLAVMSGRRALGATGRRGSDDVRSPTAARALVQWLPSSLSLLGATTPDEAGSFLVRRLTIIDADGLLIHDSADKSRLPAKLLEAPDSHGADRWSRAAALFPDRLIRELASRDQENPLRLLLMPSGLFHLHFDALRLPDGRPLIDVAETTLHTSLTSLDYLARRSSPGGGQFGAQAYAEDDLDVALERSALSAHFPPGVKIATKLDLRRMSDTVHEHALLGVGVHGTDDEDGWAQGKQLPDGEMLTAAEVFDYRFPELVVLASCHTRLHTRRGLDLAGFPLALFARGARTVVGGVSTLSDGATGQIMQLFFPLLGEGLSPVSALRQARLTWLDQDPSRRGQPDLWGRLVVYGNADQ